MKSVRLLALALAVTLTAAGCSHTVAVYSVPEGAEVFVDGRSIGRTPAQFVERSGYHKQYEFRAELAGFQPWTEQQAQDKPSRLLIPSVVGAYFLLLPIVGVLWGYQLDDQVTLLLKPVEGGAGQRGD
jgi:hypothetical protein